MSNKKHYLAAVAAFVIWGFFPLPLRALMSYSAGEILYFRILFSLAVLVIVIFGFRRKQLQAERQRFNSLDRQSRRSAVLLTVGGAVILTINWLTFIYIVNNINVKTASFAYLICPVITAILGFLLIRERLTTMQWIAVGLCGFSCVMMGISSLRELGFSFFTAFTYALYLITQRRNQGFDRIIVLGIQVLISFLIMSCGVTFLVSSVPTSLFFYSNILIIAVLFTVVPLFLNLFALNRINSATVGILMYLNPLINFTLAFVVYHESVTTVQLSGYAIIAFALVMFNLENFQKLKVALKG